MKKLVLIPVFICSLFSCSNKDEFNPEHFPQKWKLVSMTGQIPGTLTGAEMAWQEFYLFNSDGTFKKSRERNGVLVEAGGTFSIDKASDGNYLTLVYPADNEIIGSCTGLKEILRVRSNNLLSSTWWNCDGPGLEYNRVE